MISIDVYILTNDGYCGREQHCYDCKYYNSTSANCIPLEHNNTALKYKLKRSKISVLKELFK